MNLADRALSKIASQRGFSLVRAGVPGDMGKEFPALYEKCRHYTMTSVERLFALAEATRFVVDAGVHGDLVECGVWKGGSALMMALSLVNVGVTDRALWLYDTFAGMVEPTEEDGSFAHERWTKANRDGYNEWCHSSLSSVQEVMASSEYPKDMVNFVVGKVEDTVPHKLPEAIAVLRLDTDWYESTMHELVHFWPLVSAGGILIVDDYGHWQGARRAVDEFFRPMTVLMHRIDGTGRTIQKPF